MPNFIRHSLLLPLVCAAFASSLAAPLAHGADKPVKKESAFGGGKGPYLTKEELRVCLNRQTKVKADDAAMLKEKAEITSAQDELVRSGVELKQRLETVDRTNAEALAAYNQDTSARDAKIDAFQKRVDEFNARVLANQAERDAFGNGCNNRRYFEEDEQAIRKGK